MQIPVVPAHFVSVPPTVHDQWLASLNRHGILYVSGLLGLGKTVQAAHFAQAQYKERAYFTADAPDFLASVETYFHTHKRKRNKVLLILDDLQWVQEESDQRWLYALLDKRDALEGTVHILLISRGDLPPYLTPLRITQRLEVADKSLLPLGEREVSALCATYDGLAGMEDTRLQSIARHCLRATYGYGLWVQAYIQRLLETPDDLDTVVARTTQDICYQLDTMFFHNWSAVHKEGLLRLGVFHTFTLDGARLVLGERAPQLLQELLYLASVLQFQAPDNYQFLPLFTRYLHYRLTSLAPEERRRRYYQAAEYYQQRRDFEQALRCYQVAQDTDKIAEIVIYLLENADGCKFAQLAATYIDVLTPERAHKNPEVLGARAMLATYRMEIAESQRYLQMLKDLSESGESAEMRLEATSVYVRTLMASPNVTTQEIQDNLMLCMKYVRKNGGFLRNIMPTGNFPSILNGGADLLTFAPQYRTLFPVLKTAVQTVLGTNGVGVPDVALGEYFYEQGKETKAMTHLAQGLGDANLGGNIRTQYAATAIMARLFQAEGQSETAQEILEGIRQKAVDSHYPELLDNMDASLAHCAMLRQDVDGCHRWLRLHTPNLQGAFYINNRFGLLTTARIYLTMGREMEALQIIQMLRHYATLYHRPYHQIELIILQAIVFYRRGDDWQELLLSAVELAAPYGLVRVFADQGVALLPLWKAMDWKTHTQWSTRYLASITKGLKAMAVRYPKYLAPLPSFEVLSHKEMAVLTLLAQGASNDKIAQELEFTRSNAKFHVSSIMKKLGAKNRTAVVTIAQEQGII